MNSSTKFYKLAKNNIKQTVKKENNFGKDVWLKYLDILESPKT